MYIVPAVVMLKQQINIVVTAVITSCSSLTGAIYFPYLLYDNGPDGGITLDYLYQLK